MAGSTQTLGWGIAGCGWVARDFVAPAVTEARNADPVALLDPSPGALSATGKLAPQASRHTDLGEFLSGPGLDAVYVATPNHLHREIVEAAAAAGKHVLCEKPLAPALPDAEAMAAACRRAGVVLSTAFDQRFHAAHRRLRRLVSEGALGTVCSVRIHYACWLPPEWSEDNWRADPGRAGGGALTDLAPHGLDLVQYLLDESLESVSARLQRRVFDYPVEDGAALVGNTGSGVLFLQHVSYSTPEVYPRRTLEVSGTRALAVTTDTLGQEPGGTLELVRASDGSRERVEIPSEENLSPFTGQIESFSRTILEGREPDHGPERDLHTMRLLEEAASAIPSGSPESSSQKKIQKTKEKTKEKTKGETA
ncbi:Gfo/Idh/MocA family protein [Rubrobacter aplysinae]|uniref:Gfo/Idh/MocA family protein n=1 Tax=Rubrobacter aplysinae TaxID=909625 RepID=UPI000A0567C3|nr:Gfo/Idh/MocA family oxidoreductase [Rubrobacter aplysinae]